MSKNPNKEAHPITPLGDNVLLTSIEQKQKSHSGIILPDSTDEKNKLQYGEVVTVGEGSYKGEKLVPIALKEGDTVVYVYGENINYEGTEYILTKESQVIAIINKNFKK